MICALVAGMAVERHQVFPHGVLVDTEKTLRASLRSLARRLDGIPRLSANWVDPDDVTRNGAGEIKRVHFVAADRLGDPVLFAGGPWRFADICPAPANVFNVAKYDNGDLLAVVQWRDAFPYAGNVSLSPDGERAIVSYSRQGQAVEFRVSDGQVLTLFNDIHEISQGDDLRTVSRTRLQSVGYSRERDC